MTKENIKIFQILQITFETFIEFEKYAQVTEKKLIFRKTFWKLRHFEMKFKKFSTISEFSFFLRIFEGRGEGKCGFGIRISKSMGI